MIAFAVVLLSAGFWVDCAELFRPGIHHLPVDLQAAYLEVDKREAAALAASIGMWRGELWAESAYTYAYLLWPDGSHNDQIDQSSAQARRTAETALSEAPNIAGVWLLLAGLSVRFNWPKPSTNAALKMAYYTGPSEISLMPLRVSVAASAKALSDTEIQQFVERDLHIIFFDKPELKVKIAAAYRTASPEGQYELKRLIRNIDPAFVQKLLTEIPN